jgi:serine/threonine protein kinase
MGAEAARGMIEPHVIGERFTLERLIGQGGIGEVYYGIDQQTNQPVAVKALKPHVIEDNPKLVERFRREGEALKELNHPSIVKILAVIQEDKRHYLVMEYVGGGSLYDLIKQETKLPLDRVLHTALDLSDALTRAHRLRIIHRDIKPANVLLALDGTPRLTDFGAARIEKLKTLTGEGGIVGTVSYLSPEACQGKHIDARTDIWSFGVMLFEMMTGQRPFDKATTMATVLSIIKSPLPDLMAVRPDAPPKLVNLIYQMLEKDLDRRIASMRLVGAELEAIIGQKDSGARQALDLIYRMLEKDDANTASGVRMVEAKLGVSPDRSAAEPSLPVTRGKPLTIDQLVSDEQKSPQSLVTSTQPEKKLSLDPTLPPTANRANSQTLLITGLAILVIVVIILIVLLAA